MIRICSWLMLCCKALHYLSCILSKGVCMMMCVNSMFMHSHNANFCIICSTVVINLNNVSVAIDVLDGSNFKKWKDDVFFAMSVIDMSNALTDKSPAELTAESTEEQKKRILTNGENPISCVC